MDYLRKEIGRFEEFNAMNYTFKFQDEFYTLDIEEESGKAEIEIDEKKFDVEFAQIDKNVYSLKIGDESVTIGVLKKGKKIEVFHNGELYEFEVSTGRARQREVTGDSGIQEIKSPMPGRIVKILKGEGEEVNEGEGVIVVEAMKMESELKSSVAGTVTQVNVEEGNTVESGTILLIITPPE